MSEQEILDEVFDEKKLWKGKYPISWCPLCDYAIISCSCQASSCNGGSCEKCDDDMSDFHSTKHTLQDYLTPEENKVLEKAWWLKKYILESLARGEYTINWKFMLANGLLCERAEELFANEIFLDEITNIFKKPLTKSENSGNI